MQARSALANEPAALSEEHIDTVLRKQARLVEVSLTSTPAYLAAWVISIESEPEGDPDRILADRVRDAFRSRAWSADGERRDRLFRSESDR